MISLLGRRGYHSKRMRTHQSTLTRLDNVFQPIQAMIDDSRPASLAPGRYAQKRLEEQLVRTPAFISKYIETYGLGSPRTAGAFRSLVNKKRLAVRFLDQLKPKARFIGSAIQEDQLPLATLPEIAVVGRSNAGKSTLINAIVGSRCCEMRNEPGSTQQLSFFRIGDPPKLTFVDLPGFGFAYADAAARTQWAEFTLWYLKARRNLRCALLVVDARHGLADSDLEMISFFKANKIEFRVVLNKTDLVESGTLGKRLAVLGKDLSLSDSQLLDRVVPVSALRRQGLERIRTICEQFKLKRSGGNLLDERRLKQVQQRAVRAERKEELKLELFGERDLLTARQAKPSATDTPGTSCFESEPDAYRADAQAILKRTPNTESGDIRMLEFESFVSDDEVTNLGLRGGAHRADSPSPVPGEANTNYEQRMKLNHELGWKMKLDLDTPVTVTPSSPSVTQRSHEDVSALGFISTYNPETVPKGIHRWKVVGLKPVIKTSRAKARPDTATVVQRDAARRGRRHEAGNQTANKSTGNKPRPKIHSQTDS